MESGEEIVEHHRAASAARAGRVNPDTTSTGHETPAFRPVIRTP
jgi:hypothetical protein